MASEVQECVNRANQITADLDAKVLDLAANWHPYQVLTPQEVRSAVAAASEALARADEACIAAYNAGLTDDLESLLKEFRGHVNRFQAQAQNYLNAAQAAYDQGADVDAPEFKNWTLFAMQAASDGIVAAATVSCVQPWWANVFGVFLDAFLALVDIVKGVYGVSKELVKNTVAAVEDSLGFIAWATKHLRVLTLGALVLVGGGYLYYNKRKYGQLLPPRGSADEEAPTFRMPTREMPTQAMPTRAMTTRTASRQVNRNVVRRGSGSTRDESTRRGGSSSTMQGRRGRR